MLRGLILIKMLPVMDYAAATVPWRQRRRIGRFESKIRVLQQSFHSSEPNNRRTSLGKLNRLHFQMNFPALELISERPRCGARSSAKERCALSMGEAGSMSSIRHYLIHLNVTGPIPCCELLSWVALIGVQSWSRCA
jgi:hypothetical protein